MCDKWLGSVVSMDCGEVLGTYQGHVSKVDNDNQTISITAAFRNGVQCKVPELTISALDIKDLRIIKTQTEAKNMPSVRVSVNGNLKAPSPETLSSSPGGASKNRKGGDRRHTPTSDRNWASPNKNNRHTPTNGVGIPGRGNCHNNGYINGHSSQNGNGQQNRYTPTKDETFRKRTNSASEGKPLRVITPKKGEPRPRRSSTREDCFSAPVDSFLGEFDFEKNLALFDKQAVFEEIENAGAPKIVRSDTKKPGKYRCDENVLQSGPVVYRQIKVPESSNTKELVTDCGLVVPTISPELRNRLILAAQQCGVSLERQIEMVGRSASEMVLQLLGGSHRLTPQNAHQRPTVVVLCGPNIQGAQAVNCARHLAVHGVSVTAFVPKSAQSESLLMNELKLFVLSDGRTTSNTNDLPQKPVDIIITTLDNQHADQVHGQTWFRTVVDWANQNKAPVLAVDPPAQGGPIQIKWSLGLCLPLSYSERCGQVYICDLSVPNKVFSEVGISYQSPFGHKFVVALHPKS